MAFGASFVDAPALESRLSACCPADSVTVTGRVDCADLVVKGLVARSAQPNANKVVAKTIDRDPVLLMIVLLNFELQKYLQMGERRTTRRLAKFDDIKVFENIS